MQDFETTDKFNRSRVTNGKLFSERIDMRSASCRRWRDLFAQLCDELGGTDRLSPTEQTDVRNVCSMQVLLEEMDTRIADGQAVDAGTYTHLTQTRHQILARLGLAADPKQARRYRRRGL